MKRVELVLTCLLLWAASGHAGEGLITKVRGSNLTIDTGGPRPGWSWGCL